MLWLIYSVQCFNFYRTPVTTLTEKNFPRLVDRRANLSVWGVLFHGARCPACIQMYPTWVSVAEKLKGIAHLGAVDCGSSLSLCQRFGIYGIPTLMVFHAKGNDGIHFFTSLESRVIRGIMSHVPNYVKKVNKTWVADRPKSAVLFTKAWSMADIWKGLAANLSDTKVEFGFVNDRATRSFFNVSEESVILWNEGKRYQYLGKLAFEDVRDEIIHHFDLNDRNEL
jgi:thioredoxin-like negative regulator of GroEL